MKYQNTRINKGKSLIDFPNDYTVIDIEINGNLNTGIDLLEVSAIKFRDNLKIDEFSTLIKQNSPIDYFIKKLTGITDKMIENASEVQEILPKFYEFVGDDILLGYNVNFDINFLYDNLKEYCGLSLSNDFIDVLRIAKKVMPEMEHHKQTMVAEHYGISTKGAHRAKVDCELCNACYQNLKKDIVNRFGSLESFKLMFSKTKRFDFY